MMNVNPHEPARPKSVDTYLNEFSEGGLLIAYWTLYGYTSNYVVLTFNPRGKEARFLWASVPKVVGNWEQKLCRRFYGMEELQSGFDALLRGASADVKQRVADYVNELKERERRL